MKSYHVNVNPTKYSHPHFNPRVLTQTPKKKLNIRRHLHKICFGIALGAFAIPLLSNPIIKEDDPELQRNIKLASYATMVGTTLIGLYNENSKKTIEMRRFDDMNKNASYSLERHEKNLKYARDYQIIVVKSDLETLRQAETIGAYGLPYYPQTLAPIAMSKFQPKENNENTSTSSGGIANINMNSFTLPSTSVEEKEDQKYVDFAYDYVRDTKKRNYLGMLICGGMGDNKTSMLHNMVKRWLLEQPETLFYVCDPKYWLESNPNWRSNWCGLPVYSDLKYLTKLGIPQPSVYASFEPDLEGWLKPLMEILKRRSGEDKDKFTNEEKLILPDGRFRPIVIIIDDATTLIDDINDRNKKELVSKYVNKLTTIGRSAGMTMIFISHANTASATGLSTEALRALEPVIGTRFIQDKKSMEWFKGEVQELGVQKVNASAGGKKRCFATTWLEAPYIPAANYSDKGLLDCIIPELVKIWHSTCPDGFLVQEYHTKAIQTLGYENIQAMRDESKSVPISESPTKLDDSVSERDALIALRNWSKSQEKYDSKELVTNFAKSLGVDVSEISQYQPTLELIAKMTDDEFSKFLEQN